MPLAQPTVRRRLDALEKAVGAGGFQAQPGEFGGHVIGGDLVPALAKPAAFHGIRRQERDVGPQLIGERVGFWRRGAERRGGTKKQQERKARADMRQDGHWRNASNRAKPVQMP